jgi:hypothetical protein
MKIHVTKLIMVLVISISFTWQASAQYQLSVGARIGKFASGIDIKRFFDTNYNTGIELFGGYTQEANGGFLGKVFLIKQLPILDPKVQIPLKMIVGVGPHVGYFKDPYYKIKNGEAAYYPINTFSIGIDGNFGLEYNTRKLPFTIGVDATPYYSFLNPGSTWIDFGVNIRFVMD